MANLINVERVSVGYGTRTLLDAISLGVDEGDAIGVVGRNGDGKTTLLQVLTETREPDSGRVTHTSGLSVGYLRQSRRFRRGRHGAGTSSSADVPDHIWAAEAATGAVVANLLTEVSTRPRGERLCGGERRRVALAAVLIAGHDVLVLDEPTNHLDVEVIGWLAAPSCTPVAPRRSWSSATTAGSSTRCAPRHGRCTTAPSTPMTADTRPTCWPALSGCAWRPAREARRQNLMRKELAWLRRGPPARTSKPKFRIQAANDLIANEPRPRDSLGLQRFATTRLGKDVFDLHRVRLEAGQKVDARPVSTGRSGLAHASDSSASTAPARRAVLRAAGRRTATGVGNLQARKDAQDRLPEPGARQRWTLAERVLDADRERPVG